MLHQNYPNPFNPETNISYSLPQASHVTLQIYDLSGRQVATLIDGWMPAGYHQVSWTGKHQEGTFVSSGINLCRMETATFQKTVKLLFTK